MVTTLKRLAISLLAVALCAAPSYGAVKLYNQASQPATCNVGDLWVDTDGTSGERFYTCESANTWVKHVGYGTSANPSFSSVHASGGNLAAANKQVTKAWQTGLSYTANVTSVIHGGKHWIAKTTHTADGTTEPGVGANHADAWTEVVGSGSMTWPASDGAYYGAKDGAWTSLASVYQPLDSDLTTFAGLTCTENQIPKKNSSNVWVCGSDIEGAGGGISHATSDGNYYASRNGAWASLTGIYQAADSDLTTWAGITPGTGVSTWLATPSGANLASALTTALPASKGGTGLTALGTGVATAMGNAVNGTGGLATWDNIPAITWGTGLTNNSNTISVTSPVTAEVWSGSGWNGDTDGLTRNDAYDYLVLADTDSDGLPNKVDLSSAGFVITDSSGVLSSSYTITSAILANSTSLPGTCTVGNMYYDTDADTDGELYVCRATDTWKAVDDDGGAGGLATTDIDTSSELRGIVTDESGTGALLFAGGDIAAGTATTPSANDNDTSIATTAFVQTELTGYAADSATFTNKTLDVEGTGNSITIVDKVWFAAAGCNNATATSFYDLPTANAPAAACITGTNTQKGVLDFDAGTDESAQVSLALPSDFTGAIDVKYKWLAAATSGSVVWGVQTSCVADAETDDPSWNTASTVTDAAKGTTLQTNDASMTGVTATGCAAGELLHLRFFRDADNGSDGMTGDARLIGAEVTLRRAQ